MPTTDEESVNSFDAEDKDCRRKEAYKLYKHYAKPTRENMCRILDYAKDTDMTRQDVDLLPWNPEKTEVIQEAMKSPKKKQKTEQKDKKKDKDKEEKSMPQVDVQEKCAAEDTKSNIKVARRDDRLERTFQWYTRMASPIREDFKRRVADVDSIDITPEDVDLLPWNLTGRVVNIAKMNAIIRASILKQ
jgi:hypothetical protein